MKGYKGFVAIIALLLGGCAMPPPPAPSLATPAATPPLESPSTPQTIAPAPRVVDREEALAEFTAWHIRGAMGLRDKTETISASVYWKQLDKDNYNLQLFGPLGFGNVKIVGTRGKVILTADNKSHQATKPETLLKNQTGWHIPIANLYYWIRGLPAPGSHFEKTVDAQHRIVSLQQQGWEISFLRYTSFNALDLPTKIFMRRPDLEVRLVVSEWAAS